MSRRSKKPSPDTHVEYPRRNEIRQALRVNAGRRRFLRQLAAGTTGALVIPTLPHLAHGQALEVDFSRLDSHPTHPQQPPMAADRADDTAMESDERREMADRDQVMADSATEEVTENRALWVEPGFLILLRWRRQTSDEAPVAALEAAADPVSTFLASRVTNVDDIHNLDQLHPLEQELTAMLTPLVLPARVEMLHLDHDCTVVCSALNPSRTYPEIYELRGDVAGPGWE